MLNHFKKEQLLGTTRQRGGQSRRKKMEAGRRWNGKKEIRTHSNNNGIHGQKHTVKLKYSVRFLSLESNNKRKCPKTKTN